MAKAEASLPKDQRIDFVSIVTPNHAHFPAAKTFLESGFNVVCDKPMTFDLAEAINLRDLVNKTGKLFALTHNYTGYPMVKEAREMVRKGELSKILKVVAEYPQGWLIQPIDAEVVASKEAPDGGLESEAYSSSATLLPGAPAHHMDIEKCREMCLRRAWHDALDDEDAALRLRAAANCLQDLRAFAVVPVMEDHILRL